MRLESDIKIQLRQLMKIYNKMGSVEIMRHPETEAMIAALQWVLDEKDDLPHYPEDY